MNSLKFKFLSNNNTIIDISTNYYIKEDILCFKIKNDVYKYDLKKIELIKKDEEKEITMKFKENVIIIKLLPNNIKVSYPIDNCKYKTINNKVFIEYTLESDERLNNHIFIEY